MPINYAAAQQSIKNIESAGGNYQDIGPRTKSGDRAYGAYQVMGSNIPSWTQQVLGVSMTPKQFLADPAAQDAVFNSVFGGYADQYGLAGAASMWFSGKPDTPLDITDGYTSVGSYINQFVNGYKTVDAASPAAPNANDQVVADATQWQQAVDPSLQSMVPATSQPNDGATPLSGQQAIASALGIPSGPPSDTEAYAAPSAPTTPVAPPSASAFSGPDVLGSGAPVATSAVPSGPYGADAVVTAAQSGNSDAVASALAQMQGKATLSALLQGGDTVKQNIGNYFATLPPDIQQQIAVQANVNPDLLAPLQSISPDAYTTLRSSLMSTIMPTPRLSPLDAAATDTAAAPSASAWEGANGAPANLAVYGDTSPATGIDFGTANSPLAAVDSYNTDQDNGYAPVAVASQAPNWGEVAQASMTGLPTYSAAVQTAPTYQAASASGGGTNPFASASPSLMDAVYSGAGMDSGAASAPAAAPSPLSAPVGVATDTSTPSASDLADVTNGNDFTNYGIGLQPDLSAFTTPAVAAPAAASVTAPAASASAFAASPTSLYGTQAPAGFSSSLAKALGGTSGLYSGVPLSSAQQQAVNSAYNGGAYATGSPGDQGGGIVSGPSGAFQNNPDGTYTSLTTGETFSLNPGSPSASSSSGGGTIICTELWQQGRLSSARRRAARDYGARIRNAHPWVYAGYLRWARPIVLLMRRNEKAASSAQHILAPVIEQMATGNGGWRGRLGLGVCLALSGLCGLDLLLAPAPRQPSAG